MAKRKITSSIPQGNEVSKKEYKHFDDYLCTYSFRTIPISQAGMDELAKRMRAYPDNPDNKDSDGIEPLTLGEFLDKEGVRHRDLVRWMEKHEGLRLAHEHYMQRISRRREKGALIRKYDGNVVARYQWKYDKDEFAEKMRQEARQEELIRMKEQIKAEAAGSGDVKFVYVDNVVNKILEETK